MVKVGTTSVDQCTNPNCEWRQRLIVKMSGVVDTLGHELDGADLKYQHSSPRVRQLINGRKWQHEALLLKWNEMLDEEEFNAVDDGSSSH